MIAFLSIAAAHTTLLWDAAPQLYRAQPQSCSTGWIIHAPEKIFIRVFVAESELYALDWLEEMKLNYQRYFPKLDEELSLQLGHEILNGSERVFLGHSDNIAYAINAKPYLGEKARAVLTELYPLWGEGSYQPPPPPLVHSIQDEEDPTKRSWKIEVTKGFLNYRGGKLLEEASHRSDRLYFSEMPAEICAFYPDGRHKSWVLSEAGYIEKELELKYKEQLELNGVFEQLPEEKSFDSPETPEPKPEPHSLPEKKRFKRGDLP